MRDPNRIPVILEALRKEWEASPDLRLCQLVSNIASVNEAKAIVSQDVYYIEDTEFMRDLAEYRGRHGSNAPNKTDW